MTIYRRALAAVLGVLLSVSLLASPAALAAEGREEPVRAIVTFAPEAPAQMLLAALEALPDTEVLWTYERLFSGAAVEATPSALAAIAALPGVEAAAQARLRQPQNCDFRHMPIFTHVIAGHHGKSRQPLLTAQVQRLYDVTNRRFRRGRIRQIVFNQRVIEI